MRSYPLRLLSECLNCCTDTNKFNRYFNEYYEELSPFLLRSIQLKLRIHGFRGDLEVTTKELWGNIFFEHYQSIFIKRPQAVERVQELSGTLKLTSRGELINRQINTWKKELIDGTHNVMSFFSHPNSRENDACDLEQQAQQSNRTLLSYKAQGYELLARILPHDLENPEEVFVGKAVFLEADSDITNSDSAENVDQQESQDSHRKAIKNRIAELKKIIEAKGEAAADAVVGCEGGARFSLAVAEILDQLSRILIPVMPTLYWLMNKRVMDHMRRIVLEPIDNQYEQTSNDVEEENSDEDIFEQVIFEQTIYVDKKKEIKINEEEQYLHMHVRNLLQRPADEAWHMLQQPNLTDQQRKQAQRRFCHCEQLCKDNLEVYELKFLGHSQEEIASILGLTRDQVRGRLKEIRQLLEPLEELLRRRED